MKCFHCQEDAKYKCPTCREGYCSVECSKIHKQECAGQKVETQKDSSNNNLESTAPLDENSNKESEEESISKVTEGKTANRFEALSKSQKLKDMISNDPILQNYIKTINSSDDPTIFLDQLKENARFIEFTKLVKELLGEN